LDVMQNGLLSNSFDANLACAFGLGPSWDLVVHLSPIGTELGPTWDGMHLAWDQVELRAARVHLRWERFRAEPGCDWD
jgi:hypothetical protein